MTARYLTVDGPLATQDADGWLATGDLGYLVDGQVVVCGRRQGRDHHGRPQHLPDRHRAGGRSRSQGVRAGQRGGRAAGRGQQAGAFAVAVESTLAGDQDAEHALGKEVTARVVDAVGVRPVGVYVLGAGTLPKTPSGKLRRSAAADLVATRAAV